MKVFNKRVLGINLNILTIFNKKMFYSVFLDDKRDFKASYFSVRIEITKKM